MIRGGSDLEVLNAEGNTPLADAIIKDRMSCAELLLDKGAKMDNVREIPVWLKEMAAKRSNAKKGSLAFVGVLRKRFRVFGGGTELIGGRLPRDLVGLLGEYLWATRLDNRWKFGNNNT